jgi:hypothetical protein
MVTTTVRDILTAAYNRSTKNKPGTIATESTELVQVVLRRQRFYYALAPRINYTYYAGFADVTADRESGGPINEGWPRPQEAEAVFRLEWTHETTGPVVQAARTEIKIVGCDDPGAEQGMPAVFRIGQTYFPAGNALDPTGGMIRMFFSRRPTDPKQLTDKLDPQWTEQFNELLILDVARYLAKKDGRTSEATDFQDERKEVLLDWAMFLEHCDVNEVRRFANSRRFNSTTLVPLASFGLPAQ